MNFSTSTLAPEKPINVSPRPSDSLRRGSEPASPEQEITDEELIARYRESGDRAIYETVMRRYEREIYAYLRRYMGNAEMAEDAFQGTFLQVHLKCQQFDLTRRFRPWLYAIATNQAIDVQRRNKRHRMVSLDRPGSWQDDDRGGSWSEKLVGSSADPLAEASREENGRWVHDAVAKLGQPMQQVVELVYYQGLKYREAAEVLGIPVGTVKSRLHSAIHQLGGFWDDSHSSD
ncbi:RNA polymerase sigma factor [Allorhodopirellula solitaria]|uniref:ECF RNA polymerase sigma factor SigW n=1 Tax=Allorhodopirellula solitaria TaxID=2527987 RepID=A0A5C5XR46_9BACT|nr:RNA polymerase sigma factor [Allorhodopirellula solitaria]TWT65109.1 ECF RNA polymerase sigma factor SigW [Allorhodopirellula solitaria]